MTESMIKSIVLISITIDLIINHTNTTDPLKSYNDVLLSLVMKNKNLLSAFHYYRHRHSKGKYHKTQRNQRV